MNKIIINIKKFLKLYIIAIYLNYRKKNNRIINFLIKY